MSNVTSELSASTWRLENFQAHFGTSRLAGSCDLLKPERGLHSLALDASPCKNVRLLGLNLPTVPELAAVTHVEAFTRRGDLAAIYAPTDVHPFRSQAYWRLASHDLGVDEHRALAAIELVASQQTDLLDSRPDLSVGSELPCSTAWRLTHVEDSAFDEIDLTRKPAFSRPGIACFVFRLPGNALSYAEMVYPLDFETSSIDLVVPSGQAIVRTRHHLFAHRLEKGVILRARVLGLLLNRDGDLPAVAAHYANFATSDPPLTT